MAPVVLHALCCLHSVHALTRVFFDPTSTAVDMAKIYGRVAVLTVLIELSKGVSFLRLSISPYLSLQLL